MPTTANLLASLQQGRRLADEGVLQQLFQLLVGAQNIPGSVTGTGPVLGSYVNTVPHGPNVSLPPAVPGRSLLVANDSTAGTSLTVHAQADSMVNGAASVTQPGATLWQYTCYKPGTWIAVGLATGVEPAAEEETVGGGKP